MPYSQKHRKFHIVDLVPPLGVLATEVDSGVNSDVTSGDSHVAPDRPVGGERVRRTEHLVGVALDKYD